MKNPLAPVFALLTSINATLEQVDHDQALFRFIQFADEEQALFAPSGANGEGCDQGKCGFSPIPADEIPGLLAYLRKL